MRLMVSLCLLLAMLLAIDVIGLRLISRHLVVARISIEASDPVGRTVIDPKSLAAAGQWSPAADVESIVAAVARIGPPGTAGRGADFNATVAAGAAQGLDLFAAAYVLLATLQAKGVDARWVELKTTPLTSQVHVVIEIMREGRWVAIDPAFGAWLARDAVSIGAADVRAALYDGAIAAVHHIPAGPGGDAERRAQVRRDGAKALHKFHYPFVFRRLDVPWWARLPPLRYWLGPEAVIDPSQLDGHNEDIALHQWIYAGFVAGLPIACACVAGVLLVAAARSRRRGNLDDAVRPV